MRKRRRGRRVSWVWVWLLPEEGKTEAEARRKVLEMVVVCASVVSWRFGEPGLDGGLSILGCNWGTGPLVFRPC
jgi:hypothetical protein